MKRIYVNHALLSYGTSCNNQPTWSFWCHMQTLCIVTLGSLCTVWNIISSFLPETRDIKVFSLFNRLHQWFYLCHTIPVFQDYQCYLLDENGFVVASSNNEVTFTFVNNLFISCVYCSILKFSLFSVDGRWLQGPN